jgi:hypothetical protein
MSAAVFALDALNFLLSLFFRFDYKFLRPRIQSENGFQMRRYRAPIVNASTMDRWPTFALQRYKHGFYDVDTTVSRPLQSRVRYSGINCRSTASQLVQ